MRIEIDMSNTKSSLVKAIQKLAESTYSTVNQAILSNGEIIIHLTTASGTSVSEISSVEDLLGVK